MSRHARIETSHGDSRRARAVAAAVTPDNTAEVTTTTDGAVVRTEIDRQTTGGLQSTADDYVLNVRVADRVARLARPDATQRGAGASPDAASGADETDETESETDESAGETTSETDGESRDDRTERHGGPTAASDPSHDRS